MSEAAAEANGFTPGSIMAPGVNLQAPSVSAFLSKAPVANVDLSKLSAPGDAGNPNPNPWWSAAKNVLDFIETPFYMATNAADLNFEKMDKGEDATSIGSFLDDLRQGAQRGWEGGINHDPRFTKDWADVFEHAQKGTPDEGNEAAWRVGIPLDFIVDPINALPGAGLVKGAVKGGFAAVKAAAEAGGKADRLVDAGAKLAAGTEPEALQTAKVGAQAASDAGTEAGTASKGAALREAPAASGADEFNSIPSIQNILENQDSGRIGAALNAFGGAFKNSVADSTLGKAVKAFQEGFNKPIATSPQNILQAHLEGVANKEKLAEEPVANMAAPDKVKDTAPTEEAPKVDSPEGMKQEDLVSSAAQNTLANKAWESMPPEQRQATRVAEAQQRFNSLDRPLKVNLQMVDKTKSAGMRNSVNILPETQKKIAVDTINETKAYQADRNLADIGDKGYIGNPSRAKGAAAKDVGGIRHPLLYDTHANQLPWQRVVDSIGRMNTKLAETGRALSRYSKLPYATRMLKAVESNLQAVGMIPVLNLSKYADKDGYIHLTMGDILEAASAKSVDGMKGSKSTFTKDDIFKHILGSSRRDAVNPMAMNTAVETLLHERNRIFEEIKNSGGNLTADQLHGHLTRATQSIKDVLMGEGHAYGEQATKEDLVNIRATKDAAIEARGKGGADTYAKDMETLAGKLVYDPHLGTMLEQRHLYNEAMHSADLEKYVSDNWQDLKTRMFAYASGPWSADQILTWLQKTARDNRNLLPAVDRARYTDWINDLIERYITPAEQRAVKAVDPKATVADSEKTAKRLFDESGEPYGAIELHMGQLATDITRSVHPVKSFFEAKFPFSATSGFYDDVMMGNHSLSRLQIQVHQALRTYLMKYSKNGQLLDDLKDIITAAVDKKQVVGDSARELKKNIGTLFGSDPRYIKAIKSGAVSKDYLEQLLRNPKFGGLFDSIDDHWWSDADKTNLHEFWQHIQPTSSEQAADFISKLHGAVLELNSRLSMARIFEQKFGSSAAKEGYSHIKWDIGRGKTTGLNNVGAVSRASAERSPGFFDLLDKNLFYDKSAAWEIPALHRLMNESRRLSNKTVLGKFINNVVDPTTQVMKAYQTTLRPGHWVSNVMGDTIRNFMAGVYDPRSYAYNMRILSAIGRDEKLFSDSLGSKFDRAMTLSRGAYSEKIPASERKYMIPIRIKGTVQYFTATEIGRMLEDKIFLSSHGVGMHEDYLNPLERDITSKLAQGAVKATDSLLTNKLYDLQKWSALRDNLTRGALAVDTLIHGDHENIEAAMKAAFQRTRKWAPTSADFSREEAMLGRRAVFYYTWLRGMLPNIFETMITKPGVFMVPNKALYAVAKAQGVDPMSIGNPFPVSQQFPSYYYENVIGPQIKKDGGALWGFSPMAPTIDVLDTMLHGVNASNAKQGSILPAVGENLLGMANPFIQIPGQALTGQSNGVPIKDTMQYLQDQILPPQLDLLSKMSGKELYSGFQQNRTDKGNTDPNIELANFLSGLHLTNYNSPAAQRAVRGENKADLSATKTDAKRNAR